MGKKLQGAKLRAKRRATAALEELQEQQAQVAAARTVAEAPDGALFVLDTTGERAVPHHLRPSRAKPKFRRDAGLSAKEEALVERLRSKHDPETLRALAEKGRKQLELQKRGVRRGAVAANANANFDLWVEGDDDQQEPKKKKAKTTKTSKKSAGSATTTSITTNKTKKNATNTKKAAAVVVKVDVAKAGQSYHPDPVAHQTLIQKAAAIEVAREIKKRQRAAPLSQGMSEETRALLLEDSDTEDEDDEKHDNNNNNNDETATDDNAPVLAKRANKLTRAQRNKQKRRRIEEAIQEKAKREKQLNKQLNQVHQFKKELNRQEEAQRLRSKQLQEQVQKKKPIPGKDVEFRAADPEHAPLVAVALPPDLTSTTTTTTTATAAASSGSSSLRTLRPRGSLARDRVLSLADRRALVVAAPDPDARRRRRRRQKSTKGRHNADAYGSNFELMG